MKREMIIAVAAVLILGACGKTDNVDIAETEAIVTDSRALRISFEAEEGEFYLFDDNPRAFNT